jgi:hypothetical protein
MGHYNLAITAIAVLVSQVVAQDAQVTVISGGLASGWDNWSWSTTGFDKAYSGVPTAPSGKATVKGTVSRWGAISLHSNNDDFRGAKSFKVYIAVCRFAAIIFNVVVILISGL